MTCLCLVAERLASCYQHCVSVAQTSAAARAGGPHRSPVASVATVCGILGYGGLPTSSRSSRYEGVWGLHIPIIVIGRFCSGKCREI